MSRLLAIPILLAALPEEVGSRNDGNPASPSRDALARFGKLAVPALSAALRDRAAGPHVGDAFGLSSAPGKFDAAWLIAEALGLNTSGLGGASTRLPMADFFQ